MRKLFSLIAAVLFAGSMMADNYVLVTDASTLADGDQIIITDVAPAAAISTTQNNNNRGVATVTLSDGVIVPGEDVQIITLVAADANFMLQVGEDAYLYAASNSSNHLKTANAETVGDNGKFAITITEGVASVIAQGSNARNDMRYNPSSSCFSCYGSSTSVEAGLKIFKKEGGVTPPAPAVATPVISGDETFTESVIVTITCSTPEADIYYTTDGTTDPKCDCAAAPEYTQQIVLTETTTIMAAAYTGNDWSAVATKTFTKVEPLADPTNCAEAAEAALSVANNNDLYNDGAVYSITGYVTSIQTAYNAQYNNVSFWMADAADGGNVIQAYRAACASAEDAPIVGDKVTVTGSLTKYNTTPEFAAGCTYVIVEHATPVVPVNLGEKTIAEFIALANTVDTCVITGVVANIKKNSDGSYNKYGNFDLVDGEASVYVYGLLTAAGEAQKFQEMGVDEGDTLTVKAVYSLFNNNVQAKNAVFVAVKKAAVTPIEPGEEINITMSGSEVNYGDAIAYYGYWIMEAENDDYFISLSNQDLTIEQAAGTYTAAELDPEYSYILTATDSISFVDGSITLAETANGVTITGSLVGSDGNTYVLNLTYEVNNYLYDEDTDFNATFDSYTVETKYLAQYGDIMVSGLNADGSYISLDIYVPAGAENLVAGEYNIDNTGNAQTVFAGMYDGGYLIPSIAAIKTAQGISNVWYLVEGKVTIDADLNITVAAKNSLGRNIQVTLSAGHEGVENTKTVVKAIKRLVNGNVVIEKAGKKYNVNGANL